MICARPSVSSSGVAQESLLVGARLQPCQCSLNGTLAVGIRQPHFWAVADDIHGHHNMGAHTDYDRIDAREV